MQVKSDQFKQISDTIQSTLNNRNHQVLVDTSTVDFAEKVFSGLSKEIYQFY